MSESEFDQTARVRSWVTPKAVKGVDSDIAGRDVKAREPIASGEVVAVKGGHIVNSSKVANLPEAIRNSAFQIADDHFLAARSCEEYEGVMMLVNHSCDPNIGMGGNVLLVSMVDIPAGKELTIDYALFLGDPDIVLDCRCRCRSERCRGTIRGTDWIRKELQDRYRGWFSWWLQQKIYGHKGPK